MLRRRTFSIRIPKWKISDIGPFGVMLHSIVQRYDNGAVAARLINWNSIISWNLSYIDESFVLTLFTVSSRTTYETMSRMVQWNDTGLILFPDVYEKTLWVGGGNGYFTFDANRVVSSRQSLPGMYQYYQVRGIAPHGTGCIIGGGWTGDYVEDQTSQAYYIDNNNIKTSISSMSVPRSGALGCRYKNGAVLCGRWDIGCDDENSTIYAYISLIVDFYDAAFVRITLTSLGMNLGVSDVATHVEGFVACGIHSMAGSYYVVIEHYNESGVKTQILQSSNVGKWDYDVKMSSVPCGVLIRLESGALYFLDENNVLTLLSISTGSGVAWGFGGHGIGAISFLKPDASSIQGRKYIRLE